MIRPALAAEQILLQVLAVLAGGLRPSVPAEEASSEGPADGRDVLPAAPRALPAEGRPQGAREPAPAREEAGDRPSAASVPRGPEDLPQVLVREWPGLRLVVERSPRRRRRAAAQAGDEWVRVSLRAVLPNLGETQAALTLGRRRLDVTITALPVALAALEEGRGYLVARLEALGFPAPTVTFRRYQPRSPGSPRVAGLDVRV